MENFIKGYSSLLDSSQEHLNYETISVYINLHNNLSRKEKIFIENHLDMCKECSQKFIDTFDEDFEFDDKTNQVNFYQVRIEDEKKFYQSDETNIEFLFYEENSKIYLKIIRLPHGLENQNFRISAGNSVIRIVSAEENKTYIPDQPVLLENINEIEVGILNVFSMKNKHGFKINKYFIYAAASLIIAAFTIGYLYFGSFEKKAVVSGEIRSTADSSLSERKENLTAENQIINEENFKTNPVLENFVYRNVRSEEKNIRIISPKIDDTLRVPFNFQWESKLQPRYYKIILVNNKNKSVWTKTTKESKATFAGKLVSGLYYLKIFFNEELSAVSKFYIKK